MKPSSFRTSAIRILSREAGMRTFSCRAREALRMRVSMSPIGSVKLIARSPLPARLDDAGDLALQRALAEADAAHLELAQERPRAAAQRAAVVLAHRELQLAGGLRHLRKLRHGLSLYCRNGMPRWRRSARPSSSFRAVVTTVMFSPLIFSTLS